MTTTETLVESDLADATLNLEEGCSFLLSVVLLKRTVVSDRKSQRKFIVSCRVHANFTFGHRNAFPQI